MASGSTPLPNSFTSGSSQQGSSASSTFQSYTEKGTVKDDDTYKGATKPPETLSFFATPALDHAFAGISAGAVATVCINPLDLIKTQFQVNTAQSSALSFSFLRNTTWKDIITGGKVGRDMYTALADIVRSEGWRGLYRGLSPNVIGNSTSWGFYFLWYTMIKEFMAKQEEGEKKSLSASQHLLAASESGAITALMTNPIWVVKTRMFTTPRMLSAADTTPAASATSKPSLIPSYAPSTSAASAPLAYRGLWHGLCSIWKYEGMRGMYKGGGLALFGVSNGAIQFMAYEELKKWRSSIAFNRLSRRGELTAQDRADHTSGINLKLSNLEYITISGLAKVSAIALTYPYQVIRSRVQNHNTAHIYPNVPTCVRLTYAQEGARGFYKGMATNLLRILPGTCVTFVVYENVSWALRTGAQRREQHRTAGVPLADSITSAP